MCATVTLLGCSEDAPGGEDASVDAAGPSDGGGDAGTADAGGDAGQLTVGPGARPCNGGSDLCDRPYNQVSVVCTHNAMSNPQDGFAIPTPNQGYPVMQQVEDGVRCLMLDTYDVDGAPMLCHADCRLGQVPWVPLLEDMDGWLDAHPDQVLTFILESYISAAETQQALTDAGIWDKVYHHNAAPGSPWPTLQTMIDAGEQLVVFTDDGTGSNQDWLLDWREYGWETPYNDPTFTCAHGRGDPSQYDDQVFILNHYTLCEFGGCPENGVTNNAYDFMLPRAAECWADPVNNPNMQIPTFVNVDHYEVPTPGQHSEFADVFDVVDALNAAWPTPPSP